MFSEICFSLQRLKPKEVIESFNLFGGGCIEWKCIISI